MTDACTRPDDRGDLATPVRARARRRAAWELAALVATSGLTLLFESVLHLKLWFVLPAVAAWIGYVVYRARQRPRMLVAWGLSRRGLRSTTKPVVAFTLVGVAALLGYRLWAGWQPLPATALIVLAAYPLWSLAQQFALQSIVARNLRVLRVPAAAIVPIAAAGFGVAHIPDWPIVALTAVSGLVWTAFYLWRGNLWPLVFSHALLGTLAYYWVLERDPMAAFTG